MCARDDEMDYTYEIVVCFRSKDDDMKMSCQCFAGMLIHFRFGKFLALCVGPICSKVMPKFCVIQPMFPNSLASIYRAGDNDHHERKDRR